MSKVIEEAKKWIRVNSQPSNFEGVWPIAIMIDLITELESKNKEVERLEEYAALWGINSFNPKEAREIIASKNKEIEMHKDADEIIAQMNKEKATRITIMNEQGIEIGRLVGLLENIERYKRVMKIYLTAAEIDEALSNLKEKR